MNEGQAPQTLLEVIMTNEHKEERQKQLLETIEEMLSGVQPSLDMKSRDAFNPKFNQLKNLIYDVNTV